MLGSGKSTLTLVLPAPFFSSATEQVQEGYAAQMRTLIFVACCSLILLQSCSRVTEQSMSEIKEGPFKVVVRTQEMSHSGSRNVDVCVENASSSGFPDNKYQCFLNGYDFDGLSVKWQRPRVIEVSFSSGRVARFTNSAFVYPGGPVPVEFHTLLCDGCNAAPNR